MKYSVALYIGLVFLAGAVSGALGHRLYASRVVSANTVAPPSPVEWRAKFVAEMNERLKMSPTQLADLDKILDQTRDRYRELREKAKPEMKRVHDEQVEAITAILTPEQRPEYARMVEERERLRKLKEAGAR